MTPYGSYHYDVGDWVKLGHKLPINQIIGRAWLLVPKLGSRSVWRHDVCLLSNGHWDAYYYDELRPAFGPSDEDYSPL